MRNKQFYASAKRLLLVVIVLCLTSVKAMAETKVTIGGICYSLSGSKAEVTPLDSGRYSGDVVIPSEVTFNAETYKVTSIGMQAFFYCFSLTSVTIPESVTSIGIAAFKRCTRLTSVTIPEGVKSISSEAFFGCSSLTSVTIPEGVKSISDRVFMDCNSLTSVTIQEGVKSIGRAAFQDCSSLEYVSLPNSLTYIYI